MILVVAFRWRRNRTVLITVVRNAGRTGAAILLPEFHLSSRRL